ncbi:MAG: sodium:proton antiporter [Holosporaceae bacterium]|jgi:Na+/H+ antiporter NhaD/arsenite permease-like protein|nr:sodium:proton antiporter [Holosporaceae bacterium]
MEFNSPLWSIPFLGIILSMSFLPLLCPKFWRKYDSCVPLFWTAAYLFCVAYFFGVKQIVPAVLEPIITDYLPFIILIASLYIVSGGIFVDFPRGYGPFFNTAFLFFGSVVAGWIGTTGAAALLIRPFLRANSGRAYSTHLMVFFIFLVANVGGAATPLGDPPLFMGFLKGIDFFWFIKHVYPFLIGTTLTLCALFFIIDYILFKIDLGIEYEKRTDEPIFKIEGLRNVGLIALILLTVILCNFKGGFVLFGENFSYSSILRNFILLAVAFLSLKITPSEIREKNDFLFDPIKEIAELFAGIFITVAPVVHILSQGTHGTFAPLFNWIAPNGEFAASKCFWVSGMLSSILDNAPTFLIFFYLTSGDPNILMTLKSNVLTAISISTVFMGALTYVGNAPNLIVRSVSVKHGLKVPSFLGYIVWSATILGPIFFVISRFL